MIVAITGGAGFIGKHVYKKLSENPEITIRILDVRHPGFKLRGQDQFIQGDILDKKKCKELLKDVEILFHNASENSDVNIPNFLYFDVNEKGTQTLLETCTELKVKKVIYKSTIKVYGKSKGDETTPAKPRSFYGQSKLAAEKAIEAWADNSENKALILRTPVIVGPGTTANLYNFIKTIEKNRKPFYLSTDRKIKSLTSCREFADVIEHSVNTRLSFIEKGTLISNIVSEPQLTAGKIHEIICEELGIKKPGYTIPLFIAVIAAVIIEYLSLISRQPTAINAGRVLSLGQETNFTSKNKQNIGYTTSCTPEQSVRETVKWYLTQKKQ